MSSENKINILSIDLEDWFHILDNETTQHEADWAKFESRIPDQCDLLLEQLKHHDVKATFFVLGWVAKKFPNVIAKVHSLGHEIACHSNLHQLVYEQTPAQFRNDIQKAVEHIEAACGIRPNAYRAPGFSVTEKTPWAFDILAELGFDTDCSVFPAPRAHGGLPSYGEGVPRIIRTISGNVLRELPMNYMMILGRPVVYGGGGYFRLIPGSLGRYFFRQSSYNMTYFHLRDFDIDQPMIPGLSQARRFKSYVGISGAKEKFSRLLKCVKFLTVNEAAKKINWDRAKVFTP